MGGSCWPTNRSAVLTSRDLMPAHLPPSDGRLRAPAMILVCCLLLALLVGACGGKGAAKKPDGKPDSAPGSSGDAEPAPDPGYGAPAKGDCHRMTAAQSVASVDTSRKVSCKGAHTSVVSYVGYLPKPVTPATPVAQRQKLGNRLCQRAYQQVAGGTLADRATSILTWTLFTPNQAQLERGARWVRCDVIARSAGKLVALPPTSPMLAQGVPEQLRICQSDIGLDVSCAKPHAFRVQAVYRAVVRAYPAPPAYTPVARARCRQLLGTFGGYWQPPSRAGWQAGDRFIRCLSPKAQVPPTP